MTPGREPFDTHDIEDLAATDALLDRVGARTPSAHDLDDPLVAALALMAAEIDLDAVPTDVTRAALAAARPDLDVPLGPTRNYDERTGLVIGLRGAGDVRGHDLDRDQDRDLDRDLDPEPGPVHARSAVGPGEPLRRPRGRARRPEPGPTAMAPPRSLSGRPSTRPEAGRPGGRRERKLRPMTAAAVVLAAIVLGSGVSAALTGGRSVNPLTGIQQVVSVITGNRTQAQQAAYQAAERQLATASKAVDLRQYDRAGALLDAIDTRDLAPQDAERVTARIAALRKAGAR